MPPEHAGAHPRGLFATQRRDLWWLSPVVNFTVLSAFVVYATLRILEAQFLGAEFVIDNGHYHYLSPFGTPDLTFLVPAVFHSIPVLGQFMTNPAALILVFPAGFRFTCYYYRKAYYRSFVARPAACSTEAWKGRKYKGERGLMIVNNLHRYFLYAAIVITGFLAYDAVRSVVTPHGLYFGLGSVIMVVNVVLLLGFTFGCNSLRHLVGGRADCYSCDAIGKTQYNLWRGVTRLNKKHGWWAMTSLFSVALTDVYIRWVGQNPDITHVLGVIPV